MSRDPRSTHSAMQRILFISLLLAVLYTLSFAVDEICCCPDITVNLKCTDKKSDTEQTSLLKANGYVCDALDGTDVTLECNVADVEHKAVKTGTVKYSFYKTYEIGSGNIVAYDTNKAKKLTCTEAETENTCTLTGVKWSGEAHTPAKFENFDNFIYQCIVEMTLIDETTIKLPSNTMLLDIYKDEPKPNYVIRKEDKTPLNTGKAYEKLTCGSDVASDKIPSTNPRTRAKWSFKGTDQTEWTELNIPKDYPRMGLVEPDIADESKSFLEGTLILMLFDPATDTGDYRCDAEYVTTTVGKNQTYQRAEYKITGNGNDDQGSPSTKMLSAITSDTFTLKGRHVDFTCYARDTDASVADKFKWEYDYGSDTDMPVDTSTALFNGATILNEGRTLRLPSEYKYFDYKFKCRVTEGVKNIVSKQLEQPVIVPEEMYIPINTRSCSNPGSAIELIPNKKLMMSDKVDVTDPVQKLSGAAYKWMTNAAVISPFDNLISKGGINDEDKLQIQNDVFNDFYAGTDHPDQKCRYFTFFQSRTNGYQLPEVLKLTRPSDNSCADLVCSVSVIDVKDVNCEESKFTVTVGGTSLQCLSVEVKIKDGKSVYKNSFDKVVPKCSTRKLEMTITKDSMDVDKLKGEYTVFVTPDGKAGCSKDVTIDCAQPCNKPTIEDGSVSPDTATIKSGAYYTASCDPEFEMTGTATVTCTDGALSDLPTCAPKPDPPFPIWIIILVIIVLITIVVVIILVYRKVIPGKEFIEEKFCGGKTTDDLWRVKKSAGIAITASKQLLEDAKDTESDPASQKALKSTCELLGNAISKLNVSVDAYSKSPNDEQLKLVQCSQEFITPATQCVSAAVSAVPHVTDKTAAERLTNSLKSTVPALLDLLDATDRAGESFAKYKVDNTLKSKLNDVRKDATATSNVGPSSEASLKGAVGTVDYKVNTSDVIVNPSSGNGIKMENVYQDLDLNN